MGPYTKHTDQELSDMLAQYSMLSLIAQKELKKEMLHRALDIELTDIDKAIEIENQKITDLAYLKNLGFKITPSIEPSFSITRSKRGYLIDILAICIGILLLLVGIMGVASFITAMTGNSNIFSLLLGISMSIAGASGIKMLYNGVTRILEYGNFHLHIDTETFFLRKPFAAKPTTIEGPTAELYIQNFEHHQSLMFKNMEILKVEAPNIFNSNTLQEILHKSQTPNSKFS